MVDKGIEMCWFTIFIFDRFLKQLFTTAIVKNIPIFEI